MSDNYIPTGKLFVLRFPRPYFLGSGAARLGKHKSHVATLLSPHATPLCGTLNFDSYELADNHGVIN